MVERGDKLAKNDSLMITLAVVAALVFGGYMGAQQTSTPVAVLYPEPVFDETNYTLDYGEHWTIVNISNDARTDLYVTLTVLDTIFFDGIIYRNSYFVVVVANATGDALTMTWDVNYTDPSDPVDIFSVSYANSMTFEPLVDSTRIDVTVTDSGARYIVSEV